MVAKNTKGQFCVIGPNCGRFEGQVGRQWFGTEAAAIEHAQDLMRGRAPGSQAALVVQVTKVVEVEPHPIVTRNPRAHEFED